MKPVSLGVPGGKVVGSCYVPGREVHTYIPLNKSWGFP
jgi:hypothetical protein